MSSGGTVDAEAEDLGRLLLRAFRAVSASVLNELNAAGHVAIKGSHVPVLVALLMQGPAQLSALAERAGVTRQATAVMVRELSALGLVREANSEGDKRAIIASLTPAGDRFCALAIGTVAARESAWGAAIGDPGLGHLRAALHQLIGVTAGPRVP